MKLSATSLVLLRVGAATFFCSYALLAIGIFSLVISGIVSISLAHSLIVPVSKLFAPIFLTWVGLFIAFSYTYFGLSFVVRCPSCNSSLLRVPSGLEPLKVDPPISSTSGIAFKSLEQSRLGYSSLWLH